MITWAERAKAAISQTGQGGTAKTDETAFSRLLAVSSVPTVALLKYQTDFRQFWQWPPPPYWKNTILPLW